LPVAAVRPVTNVGRARDAACRGVPAASACDTILRCAARNRTTAGWHKWDATMRLITPRLAHELFRLGWSKDKVCTEFAKQPAYAGSMGGERMKALSNVVRLSSATASAKMRVSKRE
jgi:hypothetical protein